MTGPEVVHRSRIVDLLPGEIRLRCRYRRRLQRILSFTVQLELFYADDWRPIVRYDNAHGFCHRDTIHKDGTQDKMPVFYGDANDTFTDAIDDLQENWQAHRDRFLRELSDD